MVEKKTKTSHSNITKLSFEEALIELESIVKRLESGNIPLEDAIEFYNRGSLLKKHCQSRLDEAKLKVEQIIIEENDQLALKPANHS